MAHEYDDLKDERLSCEAVSAAVNTRYNSQQTSNEQRSLFVTTARLDRCDLFQSQDEAMDVFEQSCFLFCQLIDVHEQ